MSLEKPVGQIEPCRRCGAGVATHVDRCPSCGAPGPIGPVKPIKFAASFVVRRGARSGPALLTVRRPPDDDELPDLWGLPAASLGPGESWWEAVGRAGLDKLGVELGGIRLLREGRAERSGYTLHMRLFQAEVAAGDPSVPQAAGGVTQYADWAWAPPDRLREAASAGSLCSRLCLEWLGAAGPEEEARRGPAAPPRRPQGETPAANRVRVMGVVAAGHRAASGEAREPFLAGGTIRAQLPIFRERGLDLTGLHPATLNVSLAPRRLAWEHPRVTFRDVKWRPDLPAETFSFSPCRVVTERAGTEASRPEGGHPGWLYRPHPETKPRHHQPDDVVEVISRRLEGVGYGSRLVLEVDPAEVRIERG